MPTPLEKICMGCTLPICDDKDAACKFIQIERRTKRHRREATKAEAKLKEDIITILGRLVGEKAVDEARARAT
jgi:hypothetical protein